MKVEVLYKSHRYEEFDSSTQTCPEPYRGKGTNISPTGTSTSAHWRRTASSSCSIGTTAAPRTRREASPSRAFPVPAAARKVGCAMLLVSPDELDEIVWLKKDGEKLLLAGG